MNIYVKINIVEVIVILNFKELTEEKQKVVQKLESIIYGTKESLELSPLDLLYLLTNLGEKDREYITKDLEESLMLAVIRSEKRVFNNQQLTAIYKIANSFKMNDDYNAVLFTLLQTSASIKDNIEKAKDNNLDIKERSDLVTEAEALLKLNHSQLMDLSENLNEKGRRK